MLTAEEGKSLVKIAKRTIEKYVRERKISPTPEVPKKLKEERGVFVTLTKRGELRGCIGHPFPTMPLVEALVDSAISSAARDPRFPPVKPGELSELEVEISVLTKPEEIEVGDPREYLKHIAIGRDGLIVECHGYAGLLLPQVPVEQKWGVKEYLSCACMKAGLTPDHWLKKDTRIQKFSAQVFKEKTPGGDIEAREIIE